MRHVHDIAPGACQSQVRRVASFKPHAPPLRCAPVNSLETRTWLGSVILLSSRDVNLTRRPELPQRRLDCADGGVIASVGRGGMAAAAGSGGPPPSGSVPSPRPSWQVRQSLRYKERFAVQPAEMYFSISLCGSSMLNAELALKAHCIAGLCRASMASGLPRIRKRR